MSNIFSSLYNPLPFYDPCVSFVHNNFLGYRKLIADFNSTKTEDDKIKFEETLIAKRSLFEKNVMQASAPLMALLTLAFGLYCKPFHALFDISYWPCLVLCVLAGYAVGITIVGISCSLTRSSTVQNNA